MDTAEGEIDALQADTHTHDNKTVLDGITAEKVAAWDKAEENVQADWSVNDASSDAYIANRTHWVDGETVHQLDDKFIADTIARTADVEALEGRVETAETKLATIEEGAEVNAIEVVKVNGEALAVTDKAVNIVVPVGGLAGKDEVSEDELSEELAAKINDKADTTALEAAVSTLESADSALDERLQSVEAQLGDGENSVADLIATAKQEAIDAAAEDADTKDAAILAEAKADSSNKDAVVLAEAQKGIDAVKAALDAHIVEANAVTERVTTAESEIDTLQSEMDAVEALAAANKAAHEANTAAIALKASQADLDKVAGRVTTLETWHNNFVEASEEDINALFA